MNATNVINILLGAALLLWGRRLFWLFVAGVGFVFGAMLATELLGPQPEWVVLLIALALGLIGGLAAVFLQFAVVAVSGFLAGSYVGSSMLIASGYANLGWIGFLVGGVIGALLVVVLLDWALIVLSVLVGATLIVQGVPLDRSGGALLFLALTIVGVILQAKQIQPPAPAPQPTAR
jgi:hypothetical protein